MSRFSVEVARLGQHAVIRTDGYINDLGAEAIEQAYDQLAAQGVHRMVVNFARSPIINSVGLAILLGVIEKNMECEGRIVFCCLTQVNAETMEIMDVTQYVPLAETEEAAIALLTEGG
jgi:anti-anti-sigma factor